MDTGFLYFSFIRKTVMEGTNILVRDKCPVCNSTSFKSIFSHSFDESLIKKYMVVAYQGNADIEFLKGVPFNIVKCDKCNLAFQQHVLKANKLDELYNKWIDPELASEWNMQKNEVQLENYSRIMTFAKYYLKNTSPRMDILDYGAGFGDSLLIAKEMGFNPYALEYSDERIDSLEKKGINIIDDKSEMVFDFVICHQVLEHVTFPAELLNNIHSKLNKNGLAYIAVPNCPHIEKQLGNTDKIIDEKELHRALLDASVAAFQHINFFSNSNLKLLLNEHGFKQVNLLTQALVKPITIKSFLRPFYRNYFSTSLFIKRVN